MPNHDLKTAIRNTLQQLPASDLRTGTINLLGELGYQSDKISPVAGASPDAFLEMIQEHNPDAPFDLEKALFSDWKAADILFQLTDEELSRENSLFANNDLNASLMQSYLFFVIELNQEDYARGKLIAIARQLNRVFPMPVMVLIKHGQLLSVAVINRRQNKRDSGKDVLGKATIIRDISLVTPHMGHIQILSEFALQNLTGINSFDTLHAAWEDVLNVELLNKKFYNELSNWYFWAINEVSFPGEPTSQSFFKKTGSMDESKLKEAIQEHNAKNVIRLLTRFLFVWFIKEKQLIPSELFDVDYLEKEMLKDLSPYHEDGLFKSVNIQSHYYKAILQNLFFATLNQEMGKRAFRRSGQNMNVTNLLRYENYFKNPDKFIELAEKFTPFMNGGLFECLDKPHPTKKGRKGGDVIIYEDGFSDRTDNPLKVPDYLFFGHDEDVDLSHHFNSKAKKYKEAAVKGLINIFNSYKFTIAENTPVDQEIALDPELLGKVFENLLASYNPETKTTARKQTGSFYTPREIVGYMVDESLIAYLKNEIEGWGVSEEELDAKLHEMLSYDDSNPFQDNQSIQKKIIQALDHCKILDPACGSGAFPMGILQKMVHILQKVDPENTYWQELQMENAVKETETVFHLDDKEAREQKLLEINEAFDQQVNDPDYARKLFLIENCIYGVDIQPIATQISKLRFFISLVVDQKVDNSKDNFGIRPLPNLETKFVAANTLIGIDRHDRNMSFDTPEVKKKETELIEVRHRIFAAKTPRTKRKLRDEDKRIREEMGKLLIADGWASKTASQLVGWDPYDQNMSSDYFDPEWMFGIMDGFDVVIGNPPYVRPRNEGAQDINYYRNNYFVANNQLDLFHLFIEFAVGCLKEGGINSYIISNAFLANENTEKLRKFILSKASIEKIIDIKEQVFEGASVDTVVYIFTNRKAEHDHNSAYVLIEDNVFNTKHNFRQSLFSNNPRCNFTISLSAGLQSAFDSIAGTRTTVDSSFFVTTGIKEYQVGKGSPPQTQEDKDGRIFNATSKIDESYMPEIRGKNLKPFVLDWRGEHIKYGSWLAEPRSVEFFKEKKIIIRKIPSRDRQVLAVVEWDVIADQSIYVGKIKGSIEFDEYYAVGVLSSVLTHWFFKTLNNETDDLFPQIKTKQFKALPLKYDKAFFCGIQLVSKLLHFRFSADILDVLDAIIFQLYFQEVLKEKQLDVLEYVENDMDEIIRNRDFEKLPDSEKENIINQLHARWTHPDSEVRNRIKLFAVRSPDILKPILESR